MEAAEEEEEAESDADDEGKAAGETRPPSDLLPAGVVRKLRKMVREKPLPVTLLRLRERGGRR